MIEYSWRAERQIRALLLHYDKIGRTEAVANLIDSTAQAQARIEHISGAGLLPPRPYPEVAMLGYAWIKSGRSSAAYTGSRPPVIAAVFHQSADIPNRV